MESLEKKFQEFRLLKSRARSVGVPITILLKFKPESVTPSAGFPLSDQAGAIVSFAG
jgi:hypothetical protein